jgi:predicted DNA binding CopG/RHH family protein
MRNIHNLDDKKMNNSTYTQDELELLDYIEIEKPGSVPNVSNEIKQLKISVKEKISKRKSINLRLLENDLERIKAEAIKDGIPYQTLISSIIHKYVSGNLVK